MTLKLNWGHMLPVDYDGPAWGARAIFTHNDRGPSVELLWDRQDTKGGTDGERRALRAFVNDKGMAALRDVCKNVYPDQHKGIRIEVGDYVIEANPRESYGYLYICVYRRQCLQCKRGVRDSRVYFGAVGPFCDHICCEAHIAKSEVG